MTSMNKINFPAFKNWRHNELRRIVNGAILGHMAGTLYSPDRQRQDDTLTPTQERWIADMSLAHGLKTPAIELSKLINQRAGYSTDIGNGNKALRRAGWAEHIEYPDKEVLAKCGRPGCTTDFFAAVKVIDLWKQLGFKMYCSSECEGIETEEYNSVEVIDEPQCEHRFEFNRSCGANICVECDMHRGLARCYCGWAADGGNGTRQLIDMGETIEEVY